jgi:hypothetical protein
MRRSGLARSRVEGAILAVRGCQWWLRCNAVGLVRRVDDPLLYLEARSQTLPEWSQENSQGTVNVARI